MKTEEWMPDLKFRILCILADKQGHTAKDMEEILGRENKKLGEEYNLHRPMKLVFDKKTFKTLGIIAAKPRKRKIYKSNLSVELQELMLDDFIYREQREKERGKGERGRKNEFVYLIKKDKYSYLDQALLRDLQNIKIRFRAAMMGETQRTTMKNIDGSTSTVIAPIVDISDTHPIYKKRLRRFFQWNRSKNPLEFDKYIEAALNSAEYKMVDIGRPYRARINAIPEMIEIGGIDLEDCKKELKSYFEEWIALELSLGLQMPTIGGFTIEAMPP